MLLLMISDGEWPCDEVGGASEPYPVSELRSRISTANRKSTRVGEREGEGEGEGGGEGEGEMTGSCAGMGGPAAHSPLLTVCQAATDNGKNADNCFVAHERVRSAHPA